MRDNHHILGRIKAQKSVYSVKDWEQQEKEREQLVEQIGLFPKRGLPKVKSRAVLQTEQGNISLPLIERAQYCKGGAGFGGEFTERQRQTGTSQG